MWRSSFTCLFLLFISIATADCYLKPGGVIADPKPALRTADAPVVARHPEKKSLPKFTAWVHVSKKGTNQFESSIIPMSLKSGYERMTSDHVNRDSLPKTDTAPKIVPKKKPVPAHRPAGGYYYEKKRIKFRYGIEGGLNLNGLSNSNGAQSAMSSSFHAGAVLSVSFGDHVAIQPEAMFIRKGDVVNVVENQFTGNVASTATFNIDYLEFPLNVIVKVGRKSAGMFTVGGGPFVAVLLDANNPASSANGEIAAVAAPVPTTRKMDWGGNLFVGCEMPKGFFAHAGVEIGTVNVLQDLANGKYYDQNYNFTVTIGQYLGRRIINKRITRYGLLP